MICNSSLVWMIVEPRMTQNFWLEYKLTNTVHYEHISKLIKITVWLLVLSIFMHVAIYTVIIYVRNFIPLSQYWQLYYGNQYNDNIAHHYCPIIKYDIKVEIICFIRSILHWQVIEFITDLAHSNWVESTTLRWN